MRAILTALVAAIEALTIACVLLAIIVIIAGMLWWQTFDLGADPEVLWSGAASTWLLAHAVPLVFSVPESTAAALGMPPAAFEFSFSLVPLAMTCSVIGFAARAGWRWAGRGTAGAIAGIIGGGAGYGVVAAVVAPFADFAEPPLVSRVLAPIAVFAIGTLLGVLARIIIVRPPGWQTFWSRTSALLERLLAATGAAHRRTVPNGAVLGTAARELARMATMLIAAYVGIAAVGTALAFVFGMTDIMAVTQRLHLDGWGALILWVAELSYLPVMIIWAGAWLSGAGVSVGAGPVWSVFGDGGGSLPAIPAFSAIPEGWGPWGLAAPALLLVVGVCCGAAWQRRSAFGPFGSLGTVIGAALVTGAVIAGLGTLASGALGPGSLGHVGVAPWLSGGLAAAELGGGALLGALAARLDTAAVRTLVVRSAGTDPTAASAEQPKPASAEQMNDATPDAAADRSAGAVETLPEPIPLHAYAKEERRPARPFWSDDALEPIDDDAAFAETEEIDRATAEIRQPQVPDAEAARDTEATLEVPLFDREAAERAAEDASADTDDLDGAGLASDPAGHDPAALDPAAATAREAEAALRAYSWDGGHHGSTGAEAGHPEGTTPRSRWRFWSRKG